jgi:hypothetical protein
MITVPITTHHTVFREFLLDQDVCELPVNREVSLTTWKESSITLVNDESEQPKAEKDRHA